MKSKVVCIGSGNVATHLALRLFNAGYGILQVWSRSLENAQELAQQIGSPAIDNLEEINPDADIYLISVADDYTRQIAEWFPYHLGPSQIILHTSGSVSSRVLEPIAHNYGVLYPFQSLSKKCKGIDIKIPICVTSNNKKTTKKLLAIAHGISQNVYELKDEQREILQLVGVLVNNFPNHLYFLANEILTKNDISEELTFPLIEMTTKKIQQMHPKMAQTGPASRGDKRTLEKHKQLLKGYPRSTQDIYQSITQSLINLYHENRS